MNAIFELNGEYSNKPLMKNKKTTLRTSCDCSRTLLDSVWSVQWTGRCIYTKREATSAPTLASHSLVNFSSTCVRGHFRPMILPISFFINHRCRRHYNRSHNNRFCLVIIILFIYVCIIFFNADAMVSIWFLQTLD